VATHSIGGGCSSTSGPRFAKGLFANAALAIVAFSSAAAETRDVNALEEVVVTAQRRVESLQNVPISAQVISGDALIQQNQMNLQELAQTVPGVNISAQGNSDSMYIRGIGSGQNSSFDQSVATFDDDIYHGRSRLSAATFLDLERIEVLKGPQSTFFGNNAIAGALNLVTRKPSDTFDAAIRALYGMHGQYAVEGAVTVPFSNTLSVRAAGLLDGRRGWIKNVDTGDYAPDDNNKAARLTFLYKPTDNLDATLKIEASENRDSGAEFAGQPQQFNNCSGQSPQFEAIFGCAAAVNQHLPTGLNNDENSGPGGRNDLSTVEDVLTINYRQWDQTFTSVTGFSGYHFNLQSAGNFPLAQVQATTSVPERYHQFSQELRVASATNQRIEYLAGAYFQTDKIANQAEQNVPVLNSYITSTPSFAPLVPYLPVATESLYSEDEQVYAIFGSVSWNATDRLKLTVGARGVLDHKAADINGFGKQLYEGFVQDPPAEAALVGSIFGTANTPNTNGSFSRSDRAWLPSANIQFHIGPEVMGYVSYERGFLAGGFNNSDTTFIANNVPYKPEYVTAYEAGLKSKWLSDTVLLNLDVFRSDYSNLQLSDINLGTIFINGRGINGYSVIRNAAASVSQGLEFEGQWVVSREFRLSANVTYLDAYYANYRNGPPTLEDSLNGIKIQDLTGHPTLFAPKWSGRLVGTYSASLPGEFRFTTELSSYFTNGYFLPGDSSDDPSLYQSGYARLDGRLTLQSPHDRWGVDLIGKNLTNRIILTSFGSPNLASKEEPVSVALQFRYYWGRQ
jgi:iron complex outermembrane receptor protein